MEPTELATLRPLLAEWNWRNQRARNQRAAAPIISGHTNPSILCPNCGNPGARKHYGDRCGLCRTKETA